MAQECGESDGYRDIDEYLVQPRRRHPGRYMVALKSTFDPFVEPGLALSRCNLAVKLAVSGFVRGERLQGIETARKRAASLLGARPVLETKAAGLLSHFRSQSFDSHRQHQS